MTISCMTYSSQPAIFNWLRGLVLQITEIFFKTVLVLSQQLRLDRSPLFEHPHSKAPLKYSVAYSSLANYTDPEEAASRRS
jgi:hypothetical protein